MVLVTGRGFPDLATRAFLKRIETLSNAPLLFLGDFDPHGYLIYLTYVGMSIATSFESSPTVSSNTVVGASGLSVKSLKFIGMAPEGMC